MAAKRKPSLPTRAPRERAFLVGVEIPGRRGLLSMDDSLNELALLATTAGLDVVGLDGQRLRRPEPKTLLGQGKVGEIQSLAEETLADVVLFDEELSPRHQRELEKIFGDDVRVLDRTALILDIFAQHARSREGSLQVELAQYEYRLPRLTRAWTHLARQAGGGGGRAGGVGGVGLRGPGETQLEVDRREIGRRITHLKEEIERVREHRKRYRSRRRKAAIPTVALVGYTNAGKSTLLNRLAGADVLVADQLFATLDPTTRRVPLPGGREYLLTDTVGFIQKLPTMLVAAFRATLEEISDADLLLHVVDITHANARQQARAVQETLDDIGVGDIPTVTALNKVDQWSDRQELVLQLDDYERAIPVSAMTGEGIEVLQAAVDHELFESLTPARLRLPYAEGRLIHLFHEWGVVQRLSYTRNGVLIEGRIPRRLLADFRPFQIAARSRRASGRHQPDGAAYPPSDGDPA